MSRFWTRPFLGLILLALARPVPALPATTPDTAAAPESIAVAPAERIVIWITVADVIGPISARYVADALAEARDRHAGALVIEIDTPGGLDTAMREIIKGILASPVPVCVYVAPEGARAASAGAYIAMSAHVAAMAPGTNLGAATPVQLGGGQMDSTLAHKATNDAAAYLESLARMRGRNTEWARRAVVEAASLPAEKAVEENVADLIATGPRDLLRKLSGRTVRVEGDTALVVRVAEAEIVPYRMSLRYRILSALNNPNVAYLLLMLGFYGLFFELSNPGAIFPGVLGGICLILGLFALQNLTLSYAGLLLMAFGVLLFLLETQVTSHGILAIGGTISLLSGSLLLIDAPEPYLRVSLRIILPAVGATAAFFLFAVTMAMRAQHRKVVAGREGLVGMIARTRTVLNPAGTVFVAGEHWSAVSVTGAVVPLGTEVEVLAVHGLKLSVRPVASVAPAERKEIPS